MKTKAFAALFLVLAFGSLGVSAVAPQTSDATKKESGAPSPAAKPAKPAKKPARPPSLWPPVDVDQEIPPVKAGSVCSEAEVLAGAEKRVQALVRNVDRFTATELVEHQDVDRSQQLKPVQTRRFDYLVSIAQKPSGYLNVDEYRKGRGNGETFPDGVATEGTPSMALIFHPRYVNEFKMHCEGLGEWHGQPAWQVRFEQRRDTINHMTFLQYGGQGFDVRLRGRAWILAGSYEVARIETDMEDPIPEIRLRLQHEDVEYRPVSFANGKTQIWLPSSAELYMDFIGHKFYRRHSFSDFRLFSVRVEQEIANPKEDAAASVSP